MPDGNVLPGLCFGSLQTLDQRGWDIPAPELNQEGSLHYGMENQGSMLGPHTSDTSTKHPNQQSPPSTAALLPAPHSPGKVLEVVPDFLWSKGSKNGNSHLFGIPWWLHTLRKLKDTLTQFFCSSSSCFSFLPRILWCQSPRQPPVSLPVPHPFPAAPISLPSNHPLLRAPPEGTRGEL